MRVASRRLPEVLRGEAGSRAITPHAPRRSRRQEPAQTRTRGHGRSAQVVLALRGRVRWRPAHMNMIEAGAHMCRRRREMFFLRCHQTGESSAPSRACCDNAVVVFGTLSVGCCKKTRRWRGRVSHIRLEPAEAAYSSLPHRCAHVRRMAALHSDGGYQEPPKAQECGGRHRLPVPWVVPDLLATRRCL